ncbi:hypothetical protein, partial [Methylovulum psychrotolerans]
EKTEENTVRADFLRFLALGGDENAPVHERGVLLTNAWIEDELNLEGMTVPQSLSFTHCYFEKMPILKDVHIRGFLSFIGSWINGLKADRMRCSSSVFLENVLSKNSVRFPGAHIDGDLDCKNGVFQSEVDKYALECDNAIIKGSVFLNMFNATGGVCFTRAEIGSSFECDHGIFLCNNNGHALLCDNAIIKGSVFLRDNFKTIGEVRFIRAEINGDLVCDTGIFQSGQYSDNSLNFDNAEIKGIVFLNDVNATGVIRLMSAQISGNLECHAAQFKNGLNAENAVIRGSIYLNGNDDLTKKFISYGTISFLGTQIGGDFYCKNSRISILACRRAIITGGVFLNNFTATGPVIFTDSQIGLLECESGEFNEGLIYNSPAFALNCESAVIKGAIVLFNITANGVVSLSASRIGSDLICQNSNFNGNGEYALLCPAAVILGKVVLGEGFSATGLVSLARTMVGDLDCNGGTIDGKNEKALDVEGLTVAHFFRFQKMKVLNGRVSLMGAKAGTLSDDVDSWSKGQLILNGFVYERLGGKNVLTDAKSRIEWLEKQTPLHLNDKNEFKPQPWQQLQKVLYGMGYFEDVRLVAIAFQDRRREANVVGQSPKNRNKILAWMYLIISRGLHRLYGVLFCYGYYTPSRLLIEMLIVFLACGAFYSYAAYEGVFAPSNPLVFQNPKYDICKTAEILELECTPQPNWYLCSELPEEYTGFSPFLYSLDLILPLVDLQQEHDWSPMIPTPKNTWLGELKSWESPKHYIRLLMWFEILFGWVYSLLLVAVVSGLNKRREE